MSASDVGVRVEAGRQRAIIPVEPANGTVQPPQSPFISIQTPITGMVTGTFLDLMLPPWFCIKLGISEFRKAAKTTFIVGDFQVIRSPA